VVSIVLMSNDGNIAAAYRLVMILSLARVNFRVKAYQ
jgi:hypothetical protein